MSQIGPFALHQEHIAHMQLGGYQIVGNIFIATLYAQHVDAETLAQVGIAYAQTGEIRRRHHHDFGQSQVVEINLHILHLPEAVIAGKAFHLLLLTYYI